MTTSFVSYSAEWSPDNVTLLVAGRPMLTYQNDGKCSQVSWPFHLPFTVKLNLAIGGSWGGLKGVAPTIFPAEYEIDYVRVYERVDPVPPPTCDMQRVYVILRTDQAYVNLPGMSALTADTASMQETHALFTNALGTAMGLNQGPATDAITIDAVAPFRNTTDNHIHLLFNVTVHGVTPQQLANLSDIALVNQSLGTLRAQLAAWIYHSGAWDVVSSGPTCPEQCWTTDASGNTVPAPMPFQDFGIPATIPFRAYDYGGQGVGYSDTTTWNQYMQSIYRSGFDGVDIGPGNTVGYALPGEFLNFGSVYAPPCANASSRTYALFVSAGNQNGNPGIVSFAFQELAAPYASAATSVAVLPTGGWNAVEQSPPTTITLACGTRFRVTATFPSSNYNLDSFSIREL